MRSKNNWMNLELADDMYAVELEVRSSFAF